MDIAQSLEFGADTVQVDFTEGRLSPKLDPSGGLLGQFVELNNRVLDQFPECHAPESEFTLVPVAIATRPTVAPSITQAFSRRIFD